ELEEVAAGEADRTGDDAARRRGDEAQHRQGGDALPATGLPDDRQGLAGHDVKRHAVDGADDAIAGEEPGPKVGDFEEGLSSWSGWRSPPRHRAARAMSAQCRGRAASPAEYPRR